MKQIFLTSSLINYNLQYCILHYMEWLFKSKLYSMKIKEQTRKLAADCSKHCFEVVDKTDEVSSKHCFEVVDETDEVSNHTYGKATLTWFEEIFEEY